MYDGGNHIENETKDEEFEVWWNLWFPGVDDESLKSKLKWAFVDGMECAAVLIEGKKA